MSFFWGHWYPCFGFLVTSPLDFKAKVGSALFKCNVHSLKSTSGATHADLLAARAHPAHIQRTASAQPAHSQRTASAQLVTSPHACAEVGLGLDLNRQSPGQKTSAQPLCQRPGLGSNFKLVFRKKRTLAYICDVLTRSLAT